RAHDRQGGGDVPEPHHGRDHPAHRALCQLERLGRGVLAPRALLRAAAARDRGLRPRRRGRLVRLGLLVRTDGGAGSGVGPALWRGARSARHVHARRHDHGKPGGGAQAHVGRRREDRTLNAELALSAIEATGIVPVVRAPSAALAERAVSALAAGGIDVFEITLTVPGALELIASLSQRLGGRGLVGAGSVLSADQARAALDAGAQFVVSPGLDLGVLETALARDALVAPGALTPTEVLAAERAGARLVKIFPCSALGGPKYVRALRGPMPNARLLPTGGVNAATAGEYLRAGA